MNNVNLIGRLAEGPELRVLEDGKDICTFILSVGDIHSKESRTDFIRISVFGNPAVLCEKYLRKGFLAGVSGRLRADTHTDIEGIVHRSVTVVADNVRFLQWPGTEKEQKEDKNGNYNI
jgi:single-strand DNA-binding protein